MSEMDVTFVRESGESFSMEVGFFDSFREVKEKIQKYHGFPVSKQSHFCNGQPLKDDGVVMESDLCQDSSIQLQVAPSTPIKLKMKIVGPRSRFYPLQMTLDDTVLRLKERIHGKRRYVPVNAMTLKLSTETGDQLLLDHQSLRESGVSNNSKVLVFRKQPPKLTDPPPSPASASGGGDDEAKTLKLMVLPLKVTDKIPVEVNASDKVENLRKELDKLHESVLPEDRHYLFMHKQFVMSENESFQWHSVEDGDTIEIFVGSVNALEHKPKQ